MNKSTGIAIFVAVMVSVIVRLLPRIVSDILGSIVLVLILVACGGGLLFRRKWKRDAKLAASAGKG